jgi:hypothetical protein
LQDPGEIHEFVVFRDVGLELSAVSGSAGRSRRRGAAASRPHDTPTVKQRRQL